MTKFDFIEKYCNKYVWCKTEELANEFLELADSFGFTWNGDDCLLDENRWNNYDIHTVYFVCNSYHIIVNSKDIVFYEKSLIEFRSLKNNKDTTIITCTDYKITIEQNGRTVTGTFHKDNNYDLITKIRNVLKVFNEHVLTDDESGQIQYEIKSLLEN